MTKAKNKILLLGWDAADWKVINPLMEQGKMPALQKLMSKGVYGKIQTLDPPLSPMLWTSIATGVRADKHGIGGFVEPLPNGDGLRPVTSTSRKVKAVWNIFNQNDFKSNVVAWWPSNPVEPINGVMVSNLFQVANKSIEEEWEMPKGTIHPEEMKDTLKELRVHPHELTMAMLHPFIPNIAQDVALRKEKKVNAVLKTIANAATIHSTCTYLMTETEWDFMAVYHDAIDHFCHAAMRYFPPRRPQIPEKDFEDYKHVVEAGYRFHDMMLDRIMDLVDETTTIVLVSDHGFHSDHQRPLHIPNEPSGPAIEHSPYGIFLMSGPGIKKGIEISGASVLDVTPTLLYHSGLAVGKDMEGKVLYQCFENPKEAKFIPSWELVEGNTGLHSEEIREDPWAAQEALQQLVELGYIDALDDDKMLQVEKCKRENAYYVARNMIHGGNYREAIPILEDIFKESKILRYGQRLAFAYLSKKMYLKCKAVLEDLKEIDQSVRKEITSQKENNEDPFHNAELEESLYLDYIEGMLNLAMNKPRLALPLLEKVEQKNPNNLQVVNSIAQIHLTRKNYALSEVQFIKALAIDDRNSNAHYGLGLSFLRQGKWNDAVEEFLLAIENDFFQPFFHYHLGESLMHLNQYEEASQAFQVCIKLIPGMAKAHKWLLEIHENHLPNAEIVKKSRSILESQMKGEIIVVTGLDGVNFHFMFDCLRSGGIEIGDISDYVENPQKMFTTEYLDESIGKAIFISSRYLSDLPGKYNYKVIFVGQSFSETIKNKSLKLKKPLPKDSVSTQMLANIEKDQANIENWINSQPTQSYHMLDWEEVISEKTHQLESLNEYLNKKMDVDKTIAFIEEFI